MEPLCLAIARMGRLRRAAAVRLPQTLTFAVSVTYRIPFNRPTRTERDGAYIDQALDQLHLCGDGPFTARCHRMLEETLDASRVLLTTSCTHALEMAAFLARVGPGDEVIVPSFTFVSSVNAFVIRGATPVFADIRPDILGLDERQLASLVTPRTKAIVVVHYAGIGCQMVVINDGSLVKRAEILREKGTDRTNFKRGLVTKYEWIDVGSSYLPSEILAAMLQSQLEERDTVQARRAAIWRRYERELAGWAATNS